MINRDLISTSFDYHVTFNDNSDHLKYSRYYEHFGCKKIRSIPKHKGRVAIVTSGPKEFIFGLLLKILGFYVVHFYHDWEPHPGRNYYKVLFYNYISSKVFHSGFYSEKQMNSAKQMYSILSRLPVTRTDTTVDLHQRSRRIILFGRAEPYKNFSYVDRLQMHLKEINFSILIVSKGYKFEHDGVEIITDYLADNELNKLIADSVLTCLPYTSATQSGVIVHSFECGTPIMCSRLEGLTEYLVDSSLGFSFELDDEEIGERILRFMQTFDSVAFDKARRKLL